jgi:hypothetical protein
MTSKSGGATLMNVADLGSTSFFQSASAPGQWVCWDFGEMRVRPTDYTVAARLLKSWILEGSVDGRAWAEIDRRKDSADFVDAQNVGVVSLAVSKPSQCRFIRLTQTEKGHAGDHFLILYGVEFFGTLAANAGASASSVDISLESAKPLSGIISSLAKRPPVTITSKSVQGPYHAMNVAVLTSDASFISENEPGQWICWDFGGRRVRPAHYTIKAHLMKSWVVEGSVDGLKWAEIDRRKDSADFTGGFLASFAVRNSVQCRFVRLTQTDKRTNDDNHLVLYALELFGTLFE